MSRKRTAFKARHMEQLRRLGMSGYPCATLAAREIVQLNVYTYALEQVLMFGFSNTEDVQEMIAKMRDMFAPDVDMPELKDVMCDDL